MLPVAVGVFALVLGRAGQGDAAARHVARVEPCALVTKEEIRKKVEAGKKPDAVARLNAGAAVWSITTESVTHGESRDCNITWEVNAHGSLRERGELAVSIATGDWFKATVGSLNTPPIAIPGVGAEAFFLGGHERSPYARVGDIAIGIESGYGPSAVDLLKAAVARVR